jgi:hypothetical protein
VARKWDTRAFLFALNDKLEIFSGTRAVRRFNLAERLRDMLYCG